jgi:hypothetical protein
MNKAKTMLKYHSIWDVKHLRKGLDGLYHIIWEDHAVDRNILHDTGEIAILSAYFATGLADYGAPPANLYLGLDARASLAEADTLATINAAELTAGGLGAKSGYERKALSSGGTGASGQDFYINQPAAYYRADSKVVEWTAGEDWVTGLKNIFICSDEDAVADGSDAHAIASLALSATRTLLSGDKLQGSMYIGLSE